MIKKITAIALCVAFAISLCSCTLRVDDGTSPSTGGAGRQTEAPSDSEPVMAGTDSVSTDAGSEPVESTSGTEEPDESTDEPIGSDDPQDVVEVGEYNVPTDLSFLDSIPRGHFSDKNPKDANGCWYPGMTTRDLTTGNVTYNWDRAADTLALVDKYQAIYRGSDTEKYVYLTFDCGYEYKTPDEYPDGVTNDILDTLKEKNAPGTFFVTGDYLKTDSDIVKRMLDEGHIVGNHTLNHYNMTTVTPETFVEQIDANNRLLKEKIPGAPDMVFYRPPEGGANEWTLALANKMGLYTTFWSATEADYNTSNQPDPAQTLHNDKVKLHNGCVYLLHAVSTTNAKILADLIDYIRAEGYEIRPLDEFVR